MGITVKLNGGVEIHVDDHDFVAIRQAFQAALDDNKLLEIRSPAGKTVIVNPHNVLYVEGPSNGDVERDLVGDQEVSPAASPA